MRQRRTPAEWIRWAIFRPARPEPATPLTPYEAKVMSAHGYSEAQWAALPEHARREARATFTTAPGFRG